MNYKLRKIKKDSGKVYILGDLHGCYTALIEKLNAIGFNFKEDLVISVGDLIDRGTENIQCLELMSEEWFLAANGNHELMAYRGVILRDELHYDHWCNEGGLWLSYLKGTDDYKWAKELIANTESMPDIIELSRNGKTYVICHADYPRDVYSCDADLSASEVHDMKWNRDRIDGFIDGIIEERGMVIAGADHFFFGHTSLQEISSVGNCTYVDTGLVASGNVGLVDVDLF
ncbi:metallophosphoesterase [Photobacterium damselae]|uniref:metallophosphoesterase n=1 Tax=Photobacterium damselae TaxID=38293 RepID=UPI001F371036|nr:metallophosphoesterase [Photobacterium damselae]UKA05032.1 metallophosphoesterase [Photobacterium damselae subsp. damselae]